MKRVALVTSQEFSGLTADDQRLLPAFRLLGVDAYPAIWDAPEHDWRPHDAIVIRSPWDYHLKTDAFRAWLDRLGAGGIATWNPVAMLRWNLDKRYLFDLEARGIPVPPSVLITAADPLNLAATIRERDWDEVVIKPVVGGSAHGIWRTSRAEAAGRQAELEAQLLENPVLVQPYIPEVEAKGEVSLMFVGNEFSHAVRKTPRAGDYRVQAKFGGGLESIQPARGLLDAAARALAALDELPLYARVDMIEASGGPLLIELELLEPELFFRADPASAERFARGVVARLEGGNGS